MATLTDVLNNLADAIRSLDPCANPTVRIRKPFVGQRLGICLNCGHTVSLRQPWLSNQPIVNDGYYLVHCENEDCHNYYGMELKENQMSIADFVMWDKQYLIKNQKNYTTNYSKVVPFRRVK